MGRRIRCRHHQHEPRRPVPHRRTRPDGPRREHPLRAARHPLRHLRRQQRNDHRHPRQRRKRADRRRRGQTGPTRRLLQHRTTGLQRSDQARPHRPRRRHQRRPLPTKHRRRHVHHQDRYLDGGPTRGRSSRHPRPTAPRLDRPAAQGRPDEQRRGAERQLHRVPGRHRPTRRGSSRGHRTRHRLHVYRLLRMAAPAHRHPRHRTGHLHQQRHHPGHPQPGHHRQRRIHPQRLHGDHPRGRRNGRPGNRRPEWNRDRLTLRLPRRLRPHHRRHHHPHRPRPPQRRRTLRPDHQTPRPQRRPHPRIRQTAGGRQLVLSVRQRRWRPDAAPATGDLHAGNDGRNPG